MNPFKAIIALSILLCALAAVATAQTVSRVPRPTIKLPDLFVKEIVFESEPSVIRVRVMNQGGASSACHLALMSMLGEDASLGAKRVWTIEIPALEAGKGFSNTIDVSPLKHPNGPWRAVVDRSNVVKESNESNNDLTFPSSNTRNGRLPDLQITRAVLIDATNGEVSVEVSNTGTGPASGSTLRLIVWEMGQFEKKEAKTVFIKVPSISATDKTNVKVKAGVPIISTKYSLFIDISNEVTERNENNNRYEGDAGKS